MSTEHLLRVEQLQVDYPAPRRRTFRAVDAVDLAVRPGETLGLVGESGSGKSTIAKAILGIAPVSAGTISFDGVALDPERVRRRKPVTDIQAVFQDPTSSLDPSKTVGYTVAEPLLAQLDRERRKAGPGEVRDRVAAMLERVGLGGTAAARYPAQFSGGQRQRIAIARALIVDPRLVVCDEAVSALDLSIQAQVLNLLGDIRAERGISYLFISHDLQVVEHLADTVVVLYRGRVMESGPAAAIHRSPEHPYTRALLAASPVPDPVLQRERRAAREAYRGTPARADALGESCAFRHRCPFAVERCAQERPALRATAGGSVAACHRIGELPDLRPVVA
ncbi:oligopeptide/dipeptide ABC transporter ATP-binding protein [Cryptosporangium arvum]|uniref:Oligopeptide/dipeptide ABC transporter, ATP-binding protein n=1 Tax=Cryptosporangium arvum DSM 44712 TaxID=927661 RepID=A0A010ZVI1_9ACTN|nr:ABC transporter ATP-binding protein [Cryptosporangium arvum]EXG82699.1 oligopeptide/dipeptide ABC transporter, ATP-binding protein [Cryptosporangium arvum DSM 44712]